MKSFRVQITMVTMGTLVIFALVLFVALYSRNLESAQKKMDDAVEGAFSQVSATFDQTRENIAGCHSFILNNASMMDFLRENTGERLENAAFRLNVQSELLKMIKMFPWLEYVYLLDGEGNVLGASRKYSYTRSRDMDFPLYSSSFYQALPQEPTFYFMAYSSEALTDHDLNSGTQMLYSVRQMVLEGRKYYILLGIRESMIRKSYESLSGMLNGDLYLIDGTGTIASASDKSIIGTKVDSWSDEWMKQADSWTQDLREDRLFFMKLPVSNLYALISVPMENYTAGAMATLKYILTVLPVCAVIFMGILFFRLSRLMRQINLLTKAMDDMGEGQLGMQVSGMTSYEFQIMAVRFNHMSRRIERLMREKQQLERKRHRLEMETLRNQINPHFLYNSLNMIQWMAQLNEVPGIERAVKLLGGMVRPLYKEGPRCTLEEEIEYCAMFLELCSLRYGKRIHLSIEREGVPEGLIVLRLILQPVIENAVVHGLAEVKRGCEAGIRCRMEDEALVIEVEDNGRGFDAETLDVLREALGRGTDVKNLGLSGGSVGLSNVARRIMLEYGAPYGITIANRPEGGARVAIRMPVMRG